MNDKFDNRDKRCNLIDALVDDVAEMTIEELRLEMAENSVDGGDMAQHYQSLFFASAKKVGQNKLAEARRRLDEQSRQPTPISSRLSETERRRVLEKIIQDNSDGQMTLAARSSSGGIDSDLESAIEDWEELGGYEHNKTDD